MTASRASCASAAWRCATACSSTGRRTGRPRCARRTARSASRRAASRACAGRDRAVPGRPRRACASARRWPSSRWSSARCPRHGCRSRTRRCWARWPRRRRRRGRCAGARAAPAARRRWRRCRSCPSLVALRGGDLAAYHGVEHKAIAAYEQGARGRARRRQGARPLRLAPDGADARRQPRRRGAAATLVERPSPWPARAVSLASRRRRRGGVRLVRAPRATPRRARAAPARPRAAARASARASRPRTSSRSAAPRWPRSCASRRSPLRRAATRELRESAACRYSSVAADFDRARGLQRRRPGQVRAHRGARRSRRSAAQRALVPLPAGAVDLERVQEFAANWGGVLGSSSWARIVYVLWRTLKMMPQDQAGADQAAGEPRGRLGRHRRRRRGQGRAAGGRRVPARPEALQAASARRCRRASCCTGPPGTGKTLLAKAVAHESGAQFFSQSASSFVEMFAGLGAARIRRLFDEARKHAPAIIFIDELDAVGAQPRHRQQLRARADAQPAARRDGRLLVLAASVVVMAASNLLEKLDPALLRPGRFDRQVFVSPPDVDGPRADPRGPHARTSRCARTSTSTSSPSRRAA